jgi:hypothetical protein
MKSVNCTKPGYTSITCSKISNIPYNLIFTTQFNDSSILITIISCEYLNLSLNMLATSKYQPRLSSITKIFSKWISQSDLIWILQSDWLIHLEKILVILDNLGWYIDVANIFYDKFKYSHEIIVITIEESLNSVVKIKL